MKKFPLFFCLYPIFEPIFRQIRFYIVIKRDFMSASAMCWWKEIMEEIADQQVDIFVDFTLKASTSKNI